MVELPAAPRVMPLVAVALGGLATALAFPLQPIPMLAPICLWPLVFIGLAPFFARLLVTSSYRDAIVVGLAFAVPWFAVAGVWVFRVFDVVGWVLIWLPIFATVLFAVESLLVRRASFGVFWSWPLLWLAIEFVRSEWSPFRLDLLSDSLDPLDFSWFALGHPRIAAPLFAQTADLGGGYFLAVLPLLINLVLAYAWVHRAVPIRPALVAVVLAIAELGYGAWRMNEPAKGVEVVAGVVQSERFQLPVLLDMTAQLLGDHKDIQLVVWPEESFTGTAGNRAALWEWARSRTVCLAVGVEELSDENTGRNAAWWLPAVGEAGTYFKQLRVPFVEQHPASNELPIFDLKLGEATVRVGMLICYDMDFAWNPRRAANAGAELLVMPTLDETGWGGTQHAQHSLLPRLRAIENRRPVVQAATSGVSQIIDDHGRVVAEVPYRLNQRPDRPTVYREGYAAATVHANSSLSPYTAGGWLAGPIVSIAAITLLLVSLLKKPIVHT